MSAGPDLAPAYQRATRALLKVLLPVTALFVVGACAGGAPHSPAGESSVTPSSRGALPAARTLGQQQKVSMSARAVVSALSHSGMLVPNPLDITAQLCPATGCDQSVVTDTLRVTSFPTPEAAQRYARQHRLRRSGNIVVAFPPVLKAADRDKYWSAVVEMFR